MKNAVFYKNSWLMKGSKAKELYDLWNASKDDDAKKKLDKHCKEVSDNYRKLIGV